MRRFLAWICVLFCTNICAGLHPPSSPFKGGVDTFPDEGVTTLDDVVTKKLGDPSRIRVAVGCHGEAVMLSLPNHEPSPTALKISPCALLQVKGRHFIWLHSPTSLWYKTTGHAFKGLHPPAPIKVGLDTLGTCGIVTFTTLLFRVAVGCHGEAVMVSLPNHEPSPTVRMTSSSVPLSNTSYNEPAFPISSRLSPRGYRKALPYPPTLFSADTPNYRKRQLTCYAIGLGGTALVHAGLYQLWYKDYPSSKFHFFNDNHEWLQMDKAGHVFSSYYLGLAGIEAAKWAGVPENRQWKWALFGSIFQDPIEIWDGFSAGWGASAGDLIANTLGTVLSAGQHALWKEQKIIMKFSFTPSSYASIRPNMLGSNLQEQLLKDYNGQTYWLCYSPLKKKNWEWLGLGIGYGATGMLGGGDNTWQDKDLVTHDYSHIRRYRQYYLALDYNLTKIPTDSRALKTLFFILNCVKLPSPALEFSNNKLKGHWLMF